jgi:cytochrome c5
MNTSYWYNADITSNDKTITVPFRETSPDKAVRRARSLAERLAVSSATRATLTTVRRTAGRTRATNGKQVFDATCSQCHEVKPSIKPRDFGGGMQLPACDDCVA